MSDAVLSPRAGWSSGPTGCSATTSWRSSRRPGTRSSGWTFPRSTSLRRSRSRPPSTTAHPDVVVNAAAYTAVDAAEEHEDVALRVNGEGPRVLAAAVAGRPGVRLVHISTDYVFAGDASEPYSEDAQPAPRSAYGRTKLAGEVAVRDALPDRGFIVRTAWLYGVHGANFVKTMLALEATKPEISVVDDQRGQPTWSRDLARQIVMLLDSEAPAGIYHGDLIGRDHVVRVHPRDLPADRSRPRASAPHDDRCLPSSGAPTCLQRAGPRSVGYRGPWRPSATGMRR